SQDPVGLLAVRATGTVLTSLAKEHRMISPTKRWLFGAIGLLALVLAACSTPQAPAPEPSENPIVEIDGYKAEILSTQSADPNLVNPQGLIHKEPLTGVRCPGSAEDLQVTQMTVTVADWIDGRLAPYVDVFWMPEETVWNHDLVLAAHGYLPPNTDAWTVDGKDPFQQGLEIPLVKNTRDGLLCAGYAIGLSQFSKQGYSVEQGIRDTHLLNPIFWFLGLGYPKHTYIFGYSMGGIITVALAERFPWRYAGAMPVCGPDAGSLFQLDYIGNVRLLLGAAQRQGLLGSIGDPYDYGLGGTLDANGNPQIVPPPPVPGPQTWETWRDLYFHPALQTAATPQDPTDPNDPSLKFLALLATTAQGSVPGAPELDTFGPIPILQFGDLLASGPAVLTDPELQARVANVFDGPMYYWLTGGADAIDTARGSPYDNSSMTYRNPLTGSLVTLNPGDIEGDPTAFVGDGKALDYFRRYYQPNGRTFVPMVALHNLYDPDVPIEHDRLDRRLSQQAHPWRPDG
ncbi:MAG: hypothetical protein P8Y13_15405, partial [Deinococcales bacterium]